MKQSFSRSSRIFLLIVAFFFSTAALAQAPPTVEQALQSRGISENLESIRSALTDSRADVRGLAASVLAERNDRESIRPIQQLLAKSSSNYERQNLSQALLKFGDKEGNRGMKALCEDESVQEDLRLIAANQLHEANDNGCLPAGNQDAFSDNECFDNAGLSRLSKAQFSYSGGLEKQFTPWIGAISKIRGCQYS